MTIRLPFFKSFFVNLWTGDFQKPDFKQSQPAWFRWCSIKIHVLVDVCWEKSWFICKSSITCFFCCFSALLGFVLTLQQEKKHPKLISDHLFFFCRVFFFLPVPFYLLGKRLKLANIFSLSRLCAQAWMCAMGRGPEFHRCSRGSTGFKGNLAISVFPFRHPCHRSSVRAWSSLKLVSAGRVVFLKCLMCFSNRCL